MTGLVQLDLGSLEFRCPCSSVKRWLVSKSAEWALSVRAAPSSVTTPSAATPSHLVSAPRASEARKASGCPASSWTGADLDGADSPRQGSPRRRRGAARRAPPQPRRLARAGSWPPRAHERAASAAVEEPSIVVRCHRQSAVFRTRRGRLGDSSRLRIAPSARCSARARDRDSRAFTFVRREGYDGPGSCAPGR